MDDLEITSERDSSLAVALNAMPDTRFLVLGSRMTLRFKLNPDVYIGDARLIVQVNDVTLANSVVKDEFRRSVGTLPVTIPAGVLKPRNVLRITWKGPTTATAQRVMAWLLSASDFYMPHYQEAELPDLGLLRFQLYPFSLRGDLSDVIVVPTGTLNEETFAAVLELSVALGRLAPARHLAFRVRRLADLTQVERAESHLVFLDPDDRRDPLQALLPHWRSRPPTESARGRPILRAMASPWNSGRQMLVIGTPAGRPLHLAVRDAFSDATLERLGGDLAYLAAGRPESFTVGPKRRVREYSYRIYVEAWLRTNWLALPVILIGVSGLLFVAVRLALRHYTRSRG